MAKRKITPPEYGTPDEESPEWTADDFKRARSVKEFFPELLKAVENYRSRVRGRPRKDNPKQHVSLRLDPKVIEGFKAQGPGWQSRINEVLLQELARKPKRKPQRAARLKRAA